ncbi:MAG: AcrR family transcriptional regulator [Myxococcota bacterium]|jgi:AcrR family transcriptional regulator
MSTTADDWALAALHAIAETGINGLAVEPLAKRLGVTKGSFYWHFKNRAALTEAAVALWESIGTQQIIDRLRDVSDPREQLSQLLAISVEDLTHLRGEAALMSAANVGHPVIAPVYHRVSQKRLAFLTEIFSSMDVPNPATRAQVVYAAYLGAIQLAVMQPSPLDEGSLDELVSELQRTFTAR